MVDIFSANFLISIAALLAVLTMVAIQAWMRCMRRLLPRQSWWPTARKLQTAQMMSIGKTEEYCTQENVCDSYSWVLFVCLHHGISGGIMLPVVILGWEGAGTIG